jgi:hypothetical protein
MHNKLYNKLNNPEYLLEGLQYKDLDGIMKPTVHVDEFSSKMGDDEDIIVLSFFVRDKSAAKDLMSWFEKGYDFVLDADVSPGEIKPNRFLVYVEIRRRSSAPRNVQELIDDLGTLTEFDPADWMIHYNGKEQPWSEDTFAKMVPLTPDAYRMSHESDLNDIRDAAGIPPKKIYKDKTSPEIEDLKAAAGI